LGRYGKEDETIPMPNETLTRDITMKKTDEKQYLSRLMPRPLHPAAQSAINPASSYTTNYGQGGRAN